MTELLDHPAVQAGLVPLVVALVVASALARSRLAWLAVALGFAAMIAVTTGFSFSPLTASRKIVLAGLAAPLVGFAADLLGSGSRWLALALSLVAGATGVWVFASVLGQREIVAAVPLGAAVALFVAVLVALTLRLRGDGLRSSAAGVGLGLAAGIAALLSASTGFFMGGIALAASAGALVLVQIASGRRVDAGFVGTLTLAALGALFAAGTLLLAALPWYALPLFLLIPAAASLPAPARAPALARAVVLGCYALAAAAAPVLAAWLATRGASS